ncbi:hypothetical protein VTK73DRAFT_2722 [Phialemonium thermophilum]|uniref:Proteophosphoglycan ppg4 n=1 Tax=Phialemonium thermophilum TaxID=223376 RepID=A0ABR3X2U6_9PEZI
MGNTSSVEVHRRPTHKLSKPRTGNRTTAGLLSPDGFSNNTGRLSDPRLNTKALPFTPVSSPTRATTSAAPENPGAFERHADPGIIMTTGQQKDTKVWAVLRSLSSRASSSGSHRRRHSSISRTSHLPEKLSRTGSLNYESSYSSYYVEPPARDWMSPGSRTSWNYDMSSYEAKRLLHVVEEPSFEQATAMSENRTTVVSEVTWKSSNPVYFPASSTPISRANSDLSLYTPVRRRSMIQIPGLATRSGENPASRRPSFRFSHPPTPNLSRQQSFESMRSGVVSMPPRPRDSEDVPRLLTPCEDDYQSIGAFKLGSLRIVNGRASPVSPERGKAESLEQTSHDPHTEVVDHAPDPLLPVLQASATSAVRDDATKQERVENPASGQPVGPTLSPATASFQAVGAERDATSRIESPLAGAAPSEWLPDYLGELQFSPFSLTNSRPSSAGLQTTSKNTAVEDRLFEDDTGQVEYAANETLDVRLEPSARPRQPQSRQGAETQAGTKGVVRTDSGFVSAASPMSESSRRPLTKADSGYSSNVSLRSFSGSGHHSKDKEHVQSLEANLFVARSRFALSGSSDDTPSSPVSSSLHGYPQQPNREAPPPPVPPKDFLPRSPPSPHGSGVGRTLSSGLSAGEVRLSAPGATSRSRHTPSPINSTASSGGVIGHPRSPSATSPRTPVSATSEKSVSALSIGSGSVKPSKLQRLLSGTRRSTNGPPTVHPTHPVNKAAIPAVPREAQNKLHERAGLFPISTKRLALKPQLSRDTLKTIFSVGSIEHNHEAANASGSVLASSEKESVGVGEDEDATQQKHGVQTLPSIAHMAAHMFLRPIQRKPVVPRRSPSRTRSGETRQEAESDAILMSEAELSSYNSISSSLGSNAYDAAFQAMAGASEIPAHATPGRTMSLTSATRVTFDAAKVPHRSKSSSALADPQLPSPLRPRDVLPTQRTNGPPPVSMLNRRPMSLRIPPPLRHQSSNTTLGSERELSHKRSREKINSYPSSNGPSLSRKSSRESIRSYPSYEQGPFFPAEDVSASPPPIPTMHPQRSLSLQGWQRHGAPPHVLQSWDLPPSRAPDGWSNGSWLDAGSAHRLSSSLSQRLYAYPGERPSSSQSRSRRDQPPLRHRSSYDGSGRSYSRGYPPSMSNGYTAPPGLPYDPWSNYQNAILLQQYDQYGRYPYVPRGHYRNRSTSNVYGFPGAPPFRVLHSYNSPAYRNVPIWG